jgi:hypothetical protein
MSTQPDADGAQPTIDPGEWLGRDNEPESSGFLKAGLPSDGREFAELADIGPWNTGLDGINLVGPEAEQEAQAW